MWGRPIFVDTATLWEAVSEGEHPGETGGSEATQGTQPVERNLEHTTYRLDVQPP